MVKNENVSNRRTVLAATVIGSWVLSALFTASAMALEIPVPNSGLEDGPEQTAWQLGIDDLCGGPNPGNEPIIYDGTVGDPINVHSGQYSLEFKYGSYKTWQLLDVPIAQGMTLTLSIWVRMPTPGSNSQKALSVAIDGRDGVGNCVWDVASFPDPAYEGPYPNWTQLSVEYVAPSDVASIVIGIHTQSGSGCAGSGTAACDSSLWVDDISLSVACSQPPPDTVVVTDTLYVPIGDSCIYEAGDMNESQSVDAVDVVRVINIAFRSAPAIQNPCNRNYIP